MGHHQPNQPLPQDDFKSRDVALTFHVGLAVRIASRNEPPVREEATELLHGAWRRWEQAADALTTAREAEDYQAVGMRLRECLVSFATEVADPSVIPEGVQPPKVADVKAWVGLLADHLAPGSTGSDLRSYLKNVGERTWAYVNGLTHAKTAIHFDAEIGLNITSHLLATVTAAFARRAEASRRRRCEECGSYAMGGGKCNNCGWVDEDYVLPARTPPSDEELAERLAEPCTPSSDISTYISPDDFR